MSTTAIPSPPTGRFALYSEEFAADPHAVYARMREEHGPLVPVELAPGLPATLVIGYDQARRILNDEMRFPADPRAWEQAVPADCPVRPMMEWRPNALRSAGAAHARYRQANVFAIDAVDQHQLRALVEQIAESTIARFRHAGRADLLADYAQPIAFRVLSALLGCPDDIGRRIAGGMAMIFDGVDAESGNRMLTAAVAELVALRRRQPGDDIVSRLIAHGARLDDIEMAHQIVTLYGAGIEPLANTIANTWRKFLVDTAFSGDVHAGDTSTREVLEHILYRDPPLANFCITYPPYPVEIDGSVLPANEPVVISMAACNNDPALGDDPSAAGNRAHLSWSTGPHACPARTPAHLVAETAITYLLDALPEMELACRPEELTYRPGPFHRALTQLPVVFPTVDMPEGAHS